jgi:hypothetical protein
MMSAYLLKADESIYLWNKIRTKSSITLVVNTFGIMKEEVRKHQSYMYEENNNEEVINEVCWEFIEVPTI